MRTMTYRRSSPFSLCSCWGVFMIHVSDGYLHWSIEIMYIPLAFYVYRQLIIQCHISIALISL